MPERLGSCRQRNGCGPPGQHCRAAPAVCQWLSASVACADPRAPPPCLPCSLVWLTAGGAVVWGSGRRAAGARAAALNVDQVSFQWRCCWAGLQAGAGVALLLRAGVHPSGLWCCGSLVVQEGHPAATHPLAFPLPTCLASLAPLRPRHLSGLAAGVRPGYGLLDGAACEFVLGLLITFLVLACNELKNGSVLEHWVGCQGRACGLGHCGFAGVAHVMLVAAAVAAPQFAACAQTCRSPPLPTTPAVQHAQAVGAVAGHSGGCQGRRARQRALAQQRCAAAFESGGHGCCPGCSGLLIQTWLAHAWLPPLTHRC